MPVVDDWMTPTAWGATLGLSKQGAHKAVTRCGIPRREDGKVSKAVADALYRSRSRPRARAAQPDAAPPGEPTDYGHWRTRRERAEAIASEDALRKARGQLVAVEDIRRVFGRRLVGARDILRSVGARVGPLVAGLGAGQAGAALDEEMRRVEAELRALADDLETTALTGGLDHDATRH